MATTVGCTIYARDHAGNFFGNAYNLRACEALPAGVGSRRFVSSGMHTKKTAVRVNWTHPEHRVQLQSELAKNRDARSTTCIVRMHAKKRPCRLAHESEMTHVSARVTFLFKCWTSFLFLE